MPFSGRRAAHQFPSAEVDPPRAGIGVRRRARTLDAYREAVRRGYRFYSYGDAMWIPERSVMSAPGFAFETVAVDGAARAGVLTTRRGPVLTPTFMPVGTQGSVKTLTPTKSALPPGARIVLGNTTTCGFGREPKCVAELGGLSAFMRWPHATLPILAATRHSSLAERRTLSDDGFVFRSHLDGSKHS